MSNEIIKAQSVGKIYGSGASEFRALHPLNLSINERESLAIVGKSGSGKSTLMHLLALMDQPTEGEIFVEGKAVAELATRETNRLRNQVFGFVFQQYFLNGQDTVLENVALPLKIAKISKAERKIRALSALRAVELEDKAQNRANDLSGGQKQRVVIARALVNNASVLLCDEPTGALDSHTGKTIEDLLFRFNQERNVTLIIVTHDEELAAKCGRQIRLKDGRIDDV